MKSAKHNRAESYTEPMRLEMRGICLEVRFENVTVDVSYLWDSPNGKWFVGHRTRFSLQSK